MNKSSVVISVLALSFATFAQEVRDSGTTFMRDALGSYVESGELPGFISILYKDGVQETCCLGYADREAKRPITLDDCYMQCSQTKGFCGVTVAKLVEEGKLNLDDPVSRYLPEFEDLWIEGTATNDTRVLTKAKNKLTVRMCLNHTGGFPFEISAKSYRIPGGGWSGGCPVRIAAAVAASSPIRFEPGTQVLYSNTGIDIGAAVVETIVGKPWDVYLKETVLDPLEMHSSTFWPTDRQLENKIELYAVVTNNHPAIHMDQNDWEQRPYNGRHICPSAGAGLWTTARDQFKFYKMLMNLGIGDNGVRILKESTVRNLLALSSRPAGLGGYSLGLIAPVKTADDYWFGHGGAWGTSCSINWKKHELKLWVCQLCGYVNGYDWNAPRHQAEDRFFAAKIDNTEADSYTGRLK